MPEFHYFKNKYETKHLVIYRSVVCDYSHRRKTLVRSLVMDAAIHCKTYSRWPLHCREEVDAGRARKAVDLLILSLSKPLCEIYVELADFFFFFFT